MYEHIHDFYMERDPLSYEIRTTMAEEFLRRHQVIFPRDVYRWLWEGEFGIGLRSDHHTLEELQQDLRKSRQIYGMRQFPVWENQGLGMKFLRINIARYADADRPLFTLLELSKRSKDIRPDTLRFKYDWAFMKTQAVAVGSLTMEGLNEFENTISFHMTPEVEYSDEYINEFGTGYRIVPRSLFFQKFPEFRPEEELSQEILDESEN
jgi:hypothetical protein